VFSLLTPLALWLAPLLAVPLAIHFLGRAQPGTRDFPSLLPVRASLQRAMRRHRLKNWLQLILRTLALLCLLLAAAGPVWRSGSALNPPALAGLFLHNGAYAALPAAPDEGTGVTLWGRQTALRAALDSLTAGHAIDAPLFPEAGDRPVARFGQPAAAVARLLHELGERDAAAAAHAFVPVFDARDLEGIAAAARPWLEAHPGRRLVVLDETRAAARLRAFGTVRAGFEEEGMLTLEAAAATEEPPLWIQNGSARPARLRDGIASIMLPLPDTGWIAGAFSLSESDPARAGFAHASVAAAFRIPPPATLCHLGGREAVASLATLGAGGKRLRILPLLSEKDPGSGRNGPGGEQCDLLYLADPAGLDAAWLARAAAVIRTGGKVILEAGPRTDPVLWNRNLLVPLGVGRLTTVETEAAPVATRAQDIAPLGISAGNASRWGNPGAVTTRIGFLPVSGTRVLLSTVASSSSRGGAPLLIHRRIGRGEILLWTTSLSDPAWSRIGLGPWSPLLHQAFLEKSWASGVEPRAADTDSLVFLPAPDEEILRVTDPAGNPFPRLRREPGAWIAGPFDQPGLYRVESGDGSSRASSRSASQTSWLAVNLAAPVLSPSTPSEATAWKAFRTALGDKARDRMIRLEEGEDWRGLYGGIRLRTGLLILAALLLFAEGLVSLRLSPSRDGNARAT
jgi:hypothetical protein